MCAAFRPVPDPTALPSDLPILVLPARADAERDAVADAWAARGWPVCRLDRFWEPSSSLPREQARLYGDMTFCLVVAQKLELDLLSPSDDLLLTAAPDGVKRRIERATLATACQSDRPFFVKPLTPKLFPAGVFPDGGALAAHTAGFEPETAVLIAEPVVFRSEARCLVRDGAVISAAFYEGEGAIAEAMQFAREFVSENETVRTLALDVGWIEGRGWGVIEANAIWGAGLNGCDPGKMADCLVVATQAAARS